MHNRKSTSKFLSLILRHQPEVIGVTLDPEGWIDVDLLITQANAKGKNLSRDIIEDVVAKWKSNALPSAKMASGFAPTKDIRFERLTWRWNQ